jgi:hypothetical protein
MTKKKPPIPLSELARNLTPLVELEKQLEATARAYPESYAAITVRRKRGPDWVFKWAVDGYYYKARKRLYRIFIDDGVYADVWIGLLVEEDLEKKGWVTIEREIGATQVEFGRGVYHFN